MLVGQNLMNCAMCKYREQVLGFEAEVGLKQESHHHHVEGIGGGLENCPCGGDCDSSCRDEAFCKAHGLPWTPLHDHDHDHPHPHAPGHHVLAIGRAAADQLRAGAPAHDHAHDHHHQPYPHAEHPLGPVTLPKMPGRWPARSANDATTSAIPTPSTRSPSPPSAPKPICAGLGDDMQDVAVRMIHACGMVEIAPHIRASEDVVEKIEFALVEKAPILCDCEAVRAGIIARYLRGNELVVHPQRSSRARRSPSSSAPRAPPLPSSSGAIGSQDAIVVIGNAPTALFHLLDLLDAGAPKPAAIIATPVGFVGAEEAKAELALDIHGVPFITLLGRRGGSAIAAPRSTPSPGASRA